MFPGPKHYPLNYIKYSKQSKTTQAHGNGSAPVMASVPAPRKADTGWALCSLFSENPLRNFPSYQKQVLIPVVCRGEGV